LADESEFIPVMYVNENFTSSMIDHFEIDYSSPDNPYEPYPFFDEDNDAYL
jgi:hypothetical protein